MGEWGGFALQEPLDPASAQRLEKTHRASENRRTYIGKQGSLLSKKNRSNPKSTFLVSLDSYTGGPSKKGTSTESSKKIEITN